jgi:hypothetical protein
MNKVKNVIEPLDKLIDFLIGTPDILSTLHARRHRVAVRYEILLPNLFKQHRLGIIVPLAEEFKLLSISQWTTVDARKFIEKITNPDHPIAINMFKLDSYDRIRALEATLIHAKWNWKAVMTEAQQKQYDWR